jgi:hypothetical protein
MEKSVGAVELVLISLLLLKQIRIFLHKKSMSLPTKKIMLGKTNCKNLMNSSNQRLSRISSAPCASSGKTD